MKLVYLDQNKWVDVARAALAPDRWPQHREVLEMLCAKVGAGEVLLPLTSSNIYETYKINDPDRRANLAYAQVTLSGAQVFRGLHRRLEVEIAWALSSYFGLPWEEPEPGWVLSTVFFEADLEADDPRLGGMVSDRVLATVRAAPQEAMFHYLMEPAPEFRAEAVRRFTQGCEDLRHRLEERRTRHKGESLSMRRRVYSALTLFEQQDLIFRAADQIGLSWTRLRENNGAAMRAVIRDTPAIFVERELSLKLEAENRPIELNDMRDMRAFCTAVPYADVIVAEQRFTSLARQAGLHNRFGVRLETDLRSLLELV